MLVLVVGGSGSGKSEYAEQRCVQFGTQQKTYIATMEPYDQESFARIVKHQKMRSGKGFETLECYTHLEEADIPRNGTVLLECMSNLVANEMFSPAGRKEDPVSVILRGVHRMAERAEYAVIVTNQVFSDGIVYDKETGRYLQYLGEINRRAASFADEVVEVVCGIPVLVKS